MWGVSLTSKIGQSRSYLWGVSLVTPYSAWILIKYYKWQYLVVGHCMGVKCSLGDWSFLKEMVHYFKNNVTRLDLHGQVVATIENWWPPFGRNFYVFADLTSQYGHHCINMTGGRHLSTASPARGCHALQCMIGWELSCTCIVTSWSWHGDQNIAILPIVGGRHAMLTEETSTSKCNVNMMKSIVNVKREAWGF